MFIIIIIIFRHWTPQSWPEVFAVMRDSGAGWHVPPGQPQGPPHRPQLLRPGHRSVCPPLGQKRVRRTQRWAQRQVQLEIIRISPSPEVGG